MRPAGGHHCVHVRRKGESCTAECIDRHLCQSNETGDADDAENEGEENDEEDETKAEIDYILVENTTDVVGALARVLGINTLSII